MQHRRQFIQSSLAAAGAALLPASLFATTSRTNPDQSLQNGEAANFKGPFEVSPIDGDVLKFVASFSEEFYFVGASIPEEASTVALPHRRILARISNLKNFQSAITAPGSLCGSGTSMGNLFCFTRSSTRFELETLLPEEFEARLAALANGIGPDGALLRSAHESVIWNPLTHEVHVPSGFTVKHSA